MALNRLSGRRSAAKVLHTTEPRTTSPIEVASPPIADAARISRVGDDGFPDGPQWSAAPPNSFAHDWRGRPIDGSQTTTVHLLRGADRLYLRFICRYNSLCTFEAARSDTDIYPLWERDVVEVFLQPPECAGRRRYREVEVAPNGLLLDLLIAPSGARRVVGESKAKTRVDVVGKEWAADLSIPMLGACDGWRLNLFRIEGQGASRLYSAWSPTRTTAANFHVPEAFGSLRILTPLTESTAIDQSHLRASLDARSS